VPRRHALRCPYARRRPDVNQANGPDELLINECTPQPTSIPVKRPLDIEYIGLCFECDGHTELELLDRQDQAGNGPGTGVSEPSDAEGLVFC
jgi:hypothetical protein